MHGSKLARSFRALIWLALIVGTRQGWAQDDAPQTPVTETQPERLPPEYLAANPPTAGASTRQGRIEAGFQINLRRPRQERLGNGSGLWICARQRILPAFSVGLKTGVHLFQVADQFGPDNVITWPLLALVQVEHSFPVEGVLTLFANLGGGVCFNTMESVYQYRIFEAPSPSFYLQHSAAIAVSAGATWGLTEDLKVGGSVEWLHSPAHVVSDDPAAPRVLEVGHIGIGVVLAGRF